MSFLSDDLPKLKIKIEAEQELRIFLDDIDDNDQVMITLLSGTAEIFGYELGINLSIPFKKYQRIAVYTYHGCTIEIKGRITDEMYYLSTNTPMISYINCHYAIQKLRDTAKSNIEPIIGPKVLIVGPSDVGKNTLCKILLNYAIRSASKPMFIDIDPQGNMISITGTIAAGTVEHLIEANNHIGPNITIPLTYFLATHNPNKLLNIYKQQLHSLYTNISLRYNKMKEQLKQEQSNYHEILNMLSSGYIMKHNGWIENNGFDLLCDIINKYEIDVLIILGSERLYHKLKKQSSLKHLSIIKLLKSTGVDKKSTLLRNIYKKKY